MKKNVLLIMLYCVVLFLIACAAGCRGLSQTPGREEAYRWNFEREKVGALPRGWFAAETSGKGTIGKWQIIKDEYSGRKAIALLETRNTGRTFNLLIAQGTDYKNLQITVELRAMSGKIDQGGGPIWRVQDPNNYYIARWNPLENNFRVYFVKDSRRRQIASVDIVLDAKKQHKITIIHKDDKIEMSLDDTKMLVVSDATFEKGGMIGLWTKADAATVFDTIEVKELK